MRKLIWAAGVLALLWCGYWAAVTFAIRQGATQALADAARDGGFVAPSLAVGGFPTAFDIALGAVDVTDAASAIRWQSPGVQLQAAAWRPWHVNILPAPELTVTLPDQTLTLTAADLRGSLTVAPRRSADLQHVTATILQPVLASSLGFGGQADLAEVKVAPTLDTPGGYDFTFVAENLGPDAGLAALIGTNTPISRVDLTGSATFSQPLGPMADPAMLRLLAVNVESYRLVWGEVTLDLAGSIVANADGLAEGRFDIVIENWRSLIPALVGAGAIQPDVAPTITGFLNAIAAQGGKPDVLPLPLIFANGRGTLGPLPLGPAPRLH